MAESGRRQIVSDTSDEEAIPLVGSTPLPASDHPLSSRRKTFFNIFISLIGAGFLGLPHAFKKSGWISGVCSIFIVGYLSYYCMMLLVQCRKKLNWDVSTYGDVAFHVYGKLVQQATDFMIVISQAGFCVAYLIFIGENMRTLLPVKRTTFMYIATPLQILLSWVRSLTGLAPFSIFADVCNILALAIVLNDDWQNAGTHHKEAKLFTSLSQLPTVLGVAAYCFEGVSMTLPLEASMKDKDHFGWVLGSVMACVGLLYAVFGLAGYVAYGEATKDIITLNLPDGPSTAVVKLGLCISLFFTFPVMLFPVHGIVESEMVFCRWFQDYIQPSPRLRNGVLNASRALLVLLVLFVAVSVPGFGVFIQLIGSSVCSLLGFVMPAVFYMQLSWDDISGFSVAMHTLIIIYGVLFGTWGTWDALSNIFFPAVPRSG